jgi:hypothetical protein
MLFVYKNFTNVNENIKKWKGENEGVEKDIMFCVNPTITNMNTRYFTLSCTTQDRIQQSINKFDYLKS